MIRAQQLRLDAHLSPADLAKAAKVGHQTILDLEAGKRNPHTSTLAKLSTYFEVPASELLREVPEVQAA